MLRWGSLRDFHRLVLCGAGRCVVDQCPEVGSPSSEAQPWCLAGAPRAFHPHGQVREFLAFREVWHLLPSFSGCSVGVVPRLDVFLMYLCEGRCSPHLTLPPSSPIPPSATYWRDCLFSTVYYSLLYHRLIDLKCMGLFLGFLSCFIDLYVCFCASTILFDYCSFVV